MAPLLPGGSMSFLQMPGLCPDQPLPSMVVGTVYGQSQVSQKSWH